LSRPTVFDIARAAGVSLATVDRVLNQRPGVREQTIERVRSAIHRLGYVRDVSAANLARQRSYTFAFVIPEGPSAFLRSLRAAVAEAVLGALMDRTTVELVQVPPQDPFALATALDTLDVSRIDGAAIMAPETPLVRDAIRRLKAHGVAVAAIVSDLPNTGRDRFIGINNIAAGRTAGTLVGRFLGGAERPRQALVIAGSMLSRDHMERRFGFDAVLTESFPTIDVLPSIEAHDDAAALADLLPSALAARPEVAAIYSIGAGTRGLVEALRAAALPRRPVVVAHELTPEARGALEDGIFDAVITQDVGHIVRSALRVLRAHADGQAIIASQERIRIEIFLRDNLP
jgi:LacI family transcriptional regulator